MFIGIDVGNTSTMLGIYKNGSVVPEKIFRYRTVKKGDFSALGREIDLCIEEFRIGQRRIYSGLPFPVLFLKSTAHIMKQLRCSIMLRPLKSGRVPVFQ